VKPIPTAGIDLDRVHDNREPTPACCYHQKRMQFDAAGWSGEGAFTQLLIDVLKDVPGLRFLKVEDAQSSRSESSFSFISNEIYVTFSPSRRDPMTISRLSATLEALPDIGAPDYGDESMLQYLRTERIIPAYQTRGYKLIELVRIYHAGTAPGEGR
jgi:hypothetical protein